MLFRHCQDTLAASEDITASIVPGLLYFGNLDLDDRTTHRKSTLPLTPPDSTASDCAISDCQDMSTSNWTPGFTPEDWYPENALDDRLYPHLIGTDMDAFALFAATQDQIDAIPAWTSQPHDSVDTGMSPSLSYTSQSSRSLNTFPDPDHLWTAPSALPSSVPMARHASGSNVGMSPHSVPLSSAGNYAISKQPGSNTGYVPGYHVNQMSNNSSRPGHIVNTQGQTSWNSAGSIPSRTRLDNHQSAPVSSASHGHRGRRTQPSYQLGALAMDRTSLPAGSPGTFDHRNVTTTSAGLSKASVTVGHSIVDPTAEDFSTLIDFPLDDSFSVEPSRTSMVDQAMPASFTQTWTTTPASDLLDSITTDLSMPYQADVVPPQTRIAPRRVSALSVNGLEGEDGRYRTDPLYARSAEADGLYHCPFAASESCGHTPTKLKCNYDKFIDSHLKPFRCKAAECAKQAFSSTACLLRHEREAHGMHGHGKCPHLCPVPGCERSEPGRGFPRLYNCKDHQRRAHGITSPPTSPVLTATAPQPAPSRQRKVSAVRKRKASPKESAVSRRHKHSAV